MYLATSMLLSNPPLGQKALCHTPTHANTRLSWAQTIAETPIIYSKLQTVSSNCHNVITS